MEIKTNTMVGEIVRHNFSTARIFEANNIDFCCGGNISLSEAAEKEGINTNKLLTELNVAMQKEDKDSRFIESLSLAGLCDYIVKTHHTYVNEVVTSYFEGATTYEEAIERKKFLDRIWNQQLQSHWTSDYTLWSALKDG